MTADLRERQAGTLVLVGCGQMGSAMLRGWLARRRGRALCRRRAGRHAAGAGRRRRRRLAPRRRRAAGRAGARCGRLCRQAAGHRRRGAGLSPLGAAADAVSCRSPPARRSAASPAISAPRRRSSAACRTRRPRSGARSPSPAPTRTCHRGAARGCASALLAAIGESAWVEDEALIDAVTAVSGSGPAYVFLLIEALAAAGASAGLPAELALRLARDTVAGAGELARLSSETPGAAARERHEPGRHDPRRARRADGRARACAELLDRAVAAATARSRELAS